MQDRSDRTQADPAESGSAGGVQSAAGHDPARRTTRAGSEDDAFRLLADNLPTLCWMADGDGYIFWYNRGWFNYTGTTPEQMEGWGWRSVHDPQVLPEVMARWTEVIASGQPFEMTFPLRGSDGVFRPFLTRVRPLLDEGGQVIRWFGVNTDISAQRLVDQALQKSQAFTRLLLDSTDEAFYAVDREGTTTLCNKAFLRMLGFEREADVVGRGLHGLIHHSHPDGSHYPRDACPIYIAARTGQPAHVSDEVFFRLDGSSFPVEYRAVPIVQDGELQGAICTFIDITERKAMESQLRDSEARFRNMADHAPMMMWTTDPDGYCTYLNQSWYAFTGQSEGEAEGFGWLDATHPDDKARSEQAFVSANAARAPFRIEYRLRRADGAYRWALDAAAPRFGADGAYLGYIGSVIDIDERREAEDRIRDSEARFRTLTDVMPAFIWFAGPDGALQYLNDRWYAYSGMTPDESLGRGWRAALHPDDQERTGLAWGGALDGGSSYVIKVRFRRRDGVYLWHLSRAEPLRGDDGVVTAWFGTAIEIDEAERAQAVLAASAAERSAILSQLTEGVIVTDASGRISFVNDAAALLHGVARLDVAPDAYSETYHLFTEDGRPHPFEQLPLARAVNGETVLDARWRIRRPDGSEVLAIGGARPVRNTDDAQIGAVLTLRDDTARLAAERELRHLNATLEQRITAEVSERIKAEEQLRQSQKMEAVGQLTGGIAHDFNNLLAGIVGSLDMLQRRVQQGRTDGLERYSATAMASAQRAAALTQRLLAFARRQPLDPKPVEANRLLAGMEELLRRTLGAGIELEMVLAGGLWPTLCDPNQLESALLNLAINARDAMPDGGRLTIETSNAHLDEAYARGHGGEVRTGQYVTVCVSDTGTGMPPDVIAQAFDPFFTTKPIGQGTGLGLSMLYGFVKQSDGHVKIYSEEGQGTTFRLYLPRWRGGLQPADAAVSTEAALDHQAEAGETVLVVEDEPSVRMLILETLIDLGYTAVEAADGPAGLRILNSDQRIDLLVTDVGLPGLNGRQLADAARIKRPELKVLFITGYAHNAAVGNGVLEPGMEMLTKPFSIDALGLKIRSMIEG